MYKCLPHLSLVDLCQSYLLSHDLLLWTYWAVWTFLNISCSLMLPCLYHTLPYTWNVPSLLIPTHFLGLSLIPCSLWSLLWPHHSFSRVSGFFVHVLQALCTSAHWLLLISLSDEFHCQEEEEEEEKEEEEKMMAWGESPRSTEVPGTRMRKSSWNHLSLPSWHWKLPEGSCIYNPGS